MWICHRCGRDVDESLASCPQCGTRRGEGTSGEAGSQPGESLPPLDPVQELMIEQRAQRELLEIIHGRVGCLFAFLVVNLTLAGLSFLFYALLGFFQSLR